MINFANPRFIFVIFAVFQIQGILAWKLPRYNNDACPHNESLFLQEYRHSKSKGYMKIVTAEDSNNENKKNNRIYSILKGNVAKNKICQYRNETGGGYKTHFGDDVFNEKLEPKKEFSHVYSSETLKRNVIKGLFKTISYKNWLDERSKCTPVSERNARKQTFNIYVHYTHKVNCPKVPDEPRKCNSMHGRIITSSFWFQFKCDSRRKELKIVESSKMVWPRYDFDDRRRNEDGKDRKDRIASCYMNEGKVRLIN